MATGSRLQTQQRPRSSAWQRQRLPGCQANRHHWWRKLPGIARWRLNDAHSHAKQYTRCPNKNESKCQLSSYLIQNSADSNKIWCTMSGINLTQNVFHLTRIVSPQSHSTLWQIYDIIANFIRIRRVLWKIRQKHYSLLITRTQGMALTD